MGYVEYPLYADDTNYRSLYMVQKQIEFTQVILEIITEAIPALRPR